MSNEQSSSEYYENASSLDQNNRQRECLLQAFLKINKKEDSTLTKEEVSDFFENQGVLAPNLASKLIEGVFQSDEVITVNLFINNFLFLQKELKVSYDHNLSKVQQKKLAIARYEMKLNKSKSEAVDENGLCSEANVKVDLLECNMNKVGYDECQIRIKMNNEEYDTNRINPNMKMINVESFVFKPQTKDDALIVFLFGKKSVTDDDLILLGSINFSLNEMNKQEEFEIDLTIPDENDEIVGEIKIKILFIWSYYEYYKDLIEEEKKVLVNLERSIQKSQGYLDQILQIKAYKKLDSSPKQQQPQPSRQNQSQNVNQHQIKQPSTNHESDPNLNMMKSKMSQEVLKQEPKPRIEEESIAVEGEKIGPTLEELSQRRLTVYFLYVWIGICLVNFLGKAEYVSALIAFIAYCNVRYNSFLPLMKYVLIAIGASMALDILWLIISLKGVWHSSVLGKITSILVPIGILLKGGVLFKMLSSTKKKD